VQIHRQIDMRPQSLTHCCDLLNHRVQLPAAYSVIKDILLGRALQIVEIELESIKAHLCHFARLGRVGRRRVVATSVAIGIEPDRVPELASEQRIDWQTDGAPCKVPESDLDTRQGRHKVTRQGPIEHASAAHLFIEPVHIHWVLADDQASQCADDLLDASTPVDTFTSARNTGVRRNAHKAGPTVAPHLTRSDLCDLHPTSRNKVQHRMLRALGATVKLNRRSLQQASVPQVVTESHLRREY